MRYNYAENNRFVYLTGTVLPDDWDGRWSQSVLKKLFAAGRNSWLVAETRRDLPAGATVLEGGCGCADKVYSLAAAGYHAIGFDTAEKTLDRVHSVCLELGIAVADIRRFPLAHSAADGYWSLGLFEYFEEDMDEQWREASRIVRGGGYLFMNVPIMSPLRRLKAKLGAYPALGEIPVGCFYQYAYAPSEIICAAESHGFLFVHASLFDAIKGLKDETPVIRPALQRLYDSLSLAARVLHRFLNAVFQAFSGHIGYFVFRRADNTLDKLGS